MRARCDRRDWGTTVTLSAANTRALIDRLIAAGITGRLLSYQNQHVAYTRISITGEGRAQATETIEDGEVERTFCITPGPNATLAIGLARAAGFTITQGARRGPRRAPAAPLLPTRDLSAMADESGAGNGSPVIRARAPQILIDAVDAYGTAHGFSRSESVRILLMAGLARVREAGQ